MIHFTLFQIFAVKEQRDGETIRFYNNVREKKLQYK